MDSGDEQHTVGVYRAGMSASGVVGDVEVASDETRNSLQA